MAEKFNGKYRIPSARAPWWDYGWNGAYFITICTHNRRCHFGEVVPIGNPPDPPVETRFIASLPTDPPDTPDTPESSDPQDLSDPTDPPQFHVQLSEAGKIAARHWLEIPQRFPYAYLGEWVIMPNHMHGILIIHHPDDDPPSTDAIHRVSNEHGDHRDGGIASDSHGTDAIHRVSVEHTDPIDHTSSTDAMNTDAMNTDAMNADAMNADAMNADAMNTDAMNTDAMNTDAMNADAMNRVSTGGITGRHNPMLQDNLSRVIRWYKGRCTYEIRKNVPDFDWQERFHDHIIRNHASYERIETYILQNPQNWGDDRYHPDHDSG